MLLWLSSTSAGGLSSPFCLPLPCLSDFTIGLSSQRRRRAFASPSLSPFLDLICATDLAAATGHFSRQSRAMQSNCPPRIAFNKRKCTGSYGAPRLTFALNSSSEMVSPPTDFAGVQKKLSILSRIDSSAFFSFLPPPLALSVAQKKLIKALIAVSLRSARHSKEGTERPHPLWL